MGKVMIDGKFCYPLSSPPRLNAIAKLFGLNAVDPEAAKILEIGCGNGGNIVPLSARYPKSTFVGIDPSEQKIEVAKSYARELNLENIQFLNNPILDLDLGTDKFDYIMAPRIYSWASEPEQEFIFEIIRDALSPNGVAFVAYNTLPGWSSVQTLRDMMIFHGRNFADKQEQALEARRMLGFISDNFALDNSPYKKLLEAEIEFLDTVPYDVVVDDYLGSINNPTYFYKFIEKANEKGLSYLADSELPSMYLGNQTEKAAETLKEIDDIVRQEQYVDFLNYRRYRSTLLVKDTAKINRELNSEALNGLKLFPTYRASVPLEVNRAGKIEELELVNMWHPERTASISGNILCVCYQELLKSYPIPLSIDEITSTVVVTLPGVRKEEVEQVLNENVFNLIFKGLLLITTNHRGFAKANSEKPEVFKVARLEAANTNVVPNLRHEMVQLSDDQRMLAQYCDGENTKENLVEVVKNHVVKGELSIAINGVALSSDGADLGTHITQYVDTQLKIFESSILLVAPV